MNDIKSQICLDARHEYALRKMFGITLTERSIKTFLLNGYQEVTLVIPSDIDISSLFNQKKLSRIFPEIKVTLTTNSENYSQLLPTNAIYQRVGPLQKPSYLITNEETFKEAQKRLANQVRKRNTGPLMYYFYGPIAIFFSKLLSKTQITPNQITLFNLFVAAISGYLFSLGYYWVGFLAALILQLTLSIDSVDGEIARLRLEGTSFGAWFDSISDTVVEAFPLFGMVLSLFKYKPSMEILIVGMLLFFVVPYKTALLVFSKGKIPEINTLADGFAENTNIKNVFGLIKRNPIRFFLVYTTSLEIRRTIILIGTLLNRRLWTIYLFLLWYGISILYNYVRVYLVLKDVPVKIQQWKKS